MTPMLWNPEPPQGFNSELQQSIITRSIVPLFLPPQGIGGEIIAPDIPSAPLNLVALAISSTEIDLDWNTPSLEGSSPITGYQIEEQIGAGSFVIIVADTGNTDTFFNVTGLVTDTDYTYRVSAINLSGVGLVSNTDSATTFAIPDAPTSLAAMAISQTEIDLDWTTPVFDGGTPIIGYQIEREKESEGFIIIVADTGNTNTFFNDTALDSNTLYSYRVAAINSVGIGPVSNIDSVTTLKLEDPLLAIFPPIADNTFQFYKFYQIKNNQVPSTQTNMPVVIIDTLGANVLQLISGLDIRAFDSNGVPLDYEIQSADPITGEIIVWVNVPTVSDGEFIQLTFGKASATDGQNPNAVYDSNYTSVYHLNGIGNDSTVNAEDLTLFNVSSIPSKIGNGIDFVGDDTSYAIKNPYNSFPSDEFTCEFWIQVSSVGEGMVSYAIGVASSANHFLVFRQQDIQVFITNTSVDTGLVVNDGTFHQMTITWKSSTGLLLVYVDKKLEFSVSNFKTGTTFTNNGSLVLAQDQDSIGGGFNPLQALDGILDELKISNIVRSADYVTTTFNNQNDQDAFWFKTPILENNVDDLLIDDQVRNLVAVQS